AYGGLYEGFTEGLTSNDDGEDDKKGSNAGEDDSLDIAPLCRYSSLPPSMSNPFRLLCLLPGNAGQSLECQLFEASVDVEAGNDEALSYLWGDPSTCVPIRLNGFALRVSTSSRRTP
ncbi:hypothetical protein B0T14DRAFT_592585, partial [Immersiella caudata]